MFASTIGSIGSVPMQAEICASASVTPPSWEYHRKRVIDLYLQGDSLRAEKSVASASSTRQRTRTAASTPAGAQLLVTTLHTDAGFERTVSNVFADDDGEHTSQYSLPQSLQMSSTMVGRMWGAPLSTLSAASIQDVVAGVRPKPRKPGLTAGVLQTFAVTAAPSSAVLATQRARQLHSHHQRVVQLSSSLSNEDTTTADRPQLSLIPLKKVSK